MGLKLLIADDEDIIRQSVAKYIKLHTDRFEKIYEAENGQVALDLILQHQPDLMLLDVQMPLKNGIDVMQEAARAGLHPITVILSGFDEFKYAQQALKFGAKDYMLKPTRAADILKRLNDLADNYIGIEEKHSGKADAEQMNRTVKLAQEYMEEHYMENVSLTSLAKRLGISGSYLSTLFNQNLKCGFVDYLNKIRVEHACCYLEQNYFKTYEIAYKVGFKDEKYFSRVFKKITGMCPKDYKSTHQN